MPSEIGAGASGATWGSARASDSSTSSAGSCAMGCPRCRMPVDPEGDFCEHCEHWLRPGQCRFCYSDLPVEAAFCVECGSPQAGFNCPRCGRHDFFDFCPGCGNALSEAAESALNALASDPLLAAEHLADSPAPSRDDASPRPLSSDVVDEPPPVVPAPVAPARRRLFAPETFQAMPPEASRAPASSPAVDDPGVPTNSARADATRPSQDLLAELAAREQAALRLSQASATPSAKLMERPIEAMIEEAAARTFDSPQEARRFHMAFASRVASSQRVPKAWRCHRYSCVHQGPHQCSAPQFGGTWLFGS